MPQWGGPVAPVDLTWTLTKNEGNCSYHIWWYLRDAHFDAPAAKIEVTTSSGYFGMLILKLLLAAAKATDP